MFVHFLRLLHLGGFSASALRTELTSSPGRMETCVRMLIACLLIVTLSMALQIPNAALSAYMVFFVSREDMATTVTTCIALIAAMTFAIGLTLLAYLVTINSPALRICLMTVLFCVGMYLSRVLVAGPIGFGLGFILLITQSTVDLYSAVEPLVRDTLWTWMALFFPIIVVLLVNVLLLPARPMALLRQEASMCLSSVIDSLNAHLANPTVHNYATAYPMHLPGGKRLAKLLKLANAGNHRFKAQFPNYAAILKALSHLVDAAAMLPTLPVVSTPLFHSRLVALRLTCVHLRDVLNSSGVPQPPDLTPSADNGIVRHGNPIVQEIEFHLREISLLWSAFSIRLPNEAVKPARHLLVADALSNPTHLQFALKATFASMLCYILYTALAWPGIHTCVITCAVVALTSTGATLHKAMLRVIGALVGGALALLATVFIVPHLESIGGLLVVIAPVIAASAWISAGVERTAYFGWQIAFAFFLCILHGFGPNADVTLVRDRLVGILLGITIMSLVFKFVWPERAERRMRSLLARAVRSNATLLERNLDCNLVPTQFAECRSAILLDLADAEYLTGLATFEAIQSGQALLALTQRTVYYGLHLARLDMANGDAVPTQMRRAIADFLRHAADRLDEGGDADLSYARLEIDVPPILDNDTELFYTTAREAVAATSALLDAIE